MPSISIPRDAHPGRSDHEIAAALSTEPGFRYFAIVRYKNDPAAPEYTNFGLCEIPQHLVGYETSPHCHAVEVIWERARVVDADVIADPRKRRIIEQLAATREELIRQLDNAGATVSLYSDTELRVEIAASQQARVSAVVDPFMKRGLVAGGLPTVELLALDASFGYDKPHSPFRRRPWQVKVSFVHKPDDVGHKPDDSPKAAGGGCFIATACYSEEAWQVQTLRSFRDRFLRPTPVGRGLLRSYYNLSPPVARYLKCHPRVRRLVAWLIIDPIAVAVSYTRSEVPK